MATIAKTLTLTRLVNQFKKPDTGHMVLIRSLSGQVIGTATESPALSGQYTAYFSEAALSSAQFGYWYVDGVIHPEYSNNSPFWCGAHDEFSGSAALFSTATVPTFTGDTTFNNNVKVIGDLEVGPANGFIYTNGPSDGFVLTTDDSGNASWTDPTLSFGTSGTSGVSGTSGRDGTFYGSSGTSGTTFGSSGTSGITGTAGTSGTSGITGTSGTAGSSGTTLGIRTTSTTSLTLTTLTEYTWTVADITGFVVGYYVRATVVGVGTAEGLVTGILGNELTVDISFHDFTATPYDNWLLEVLLSKQGPAGSSGTSGTAGTSGTSGETTIRPPAGLHTEVQYNNNMLLDGARGFRYISSSLLLTVSGTLAMASTGSALNLFGDDLTDFHIFSGSVSVHGPLSASSLQFTSGSTAGWLLSSDSVGNAVWASAASLQTGSAGTSGTSGIAGSSGTSGFDGSSGTSGFDGSSGTSGFSAMAGYPGTFTAQTSSLVFVPGEYAFTTGSLPDVTEMYIYEEYKYPPYPDMTLFLQSYKSGDSLFITSLDNPGKYAYYYLTSTFTGMKYTLSYVSHDGMFVDKENTELVFSRRGTDGTLGTSGTSGASGAAPSGDDRTLQIKSGAVFASAPGLTYDTSTNKFRISGSMTNTGLYVSGNMFVGTGSGDLLDEYTVAYFEANANKFQQINIHNESAGVSASADIVCTNNAGGEETYYIDMGINSSNYADPKYSITGPNDSYIIAQSGALAIGVAAPLGTIKFFAGSALANSEKMSIKPNGTVHIPLTLIASSSIQSEQYIAFAVTGTAPTVQANRTQLFAPPPDANHFHVWVGKIANRNMLQGINSTGRTYSYQPALYDSNITMVAPNATTTVSTFGLAFNASGTISTIAPSATRPYTFNLKGGVSPGTQPKRTSYESATPVFYRGTTSYGANGAFAVTRVLYPSASYHKGTTFFVGFCDSSSLNALASQHPFLHNNQIVNAPYHWAGFVFRSGSVGGPQDTTWQFMVKSGSGPAISQSTGILGGSRGVADELMEFMIYFPIFPQTGSIGWQITNMRSGSASVMGVITGSTFMPAANVPLYYQLGLIASSSDSAPLDFAINRIYIESPV